MEMSAEKSEREKVDDALSLRVFHRELFMIRLELSGRAQAQS